jgi:outer membrane protease
VLNLNAGAKYTSVHWTGYGGTFVYSNTGYRADIGSFPDVPAISFQQRYPGVFLGADLQAAAGRWSFEGQVRGGVAIGANDTDHHWMRDLRFEDRYGVIPFATAAARVGYAFNDNATFYLAGSYDQYFHKIGDTTEYAISSGAQGPTSRNSAGMSLRAITLTAGFKAKF